MKLHRCTQPPLRGHIVYYLQRADGLVKIGTTRWFMDRLVELESEHGPLWVLAWEWGSYNEEAERHRQFASQHVPSSVAGDTHAGYSEWFYRSCELLAHIDRLNEPKDDLLPDGQPAWMLWA
jgi:hypothetical protein